MRLAREHRDDAGTWFRAHGNEKWEFDGGGSMARRVSLTDGHPVAEADHLLRWPLGRRSDDHPGPSGLGP